MWQKSEREIQHRGKQDCNVVCGGGLIMTMDYGFETDNDSLRAKINDMLCRIASLEDKVRELYYLIEEVQKKLEA